MEVLSHMRYPRPLRGSSCGWRLHGLLRVVRLERDVGSLVLHPVKKRYGTCYVDAIMNFMYFELISGRLA